MEFGKSQIKCVTFFIIHQFLFIGDGKGEEGGGRGRKRSAELGVVVDEVKTNWTPWFNLTDFGN